MEILMSSDQVMHELVDRWNEFQAGKAYRCTGVIELCFSEKRYYLDVGTNQLKLLQHIARPVHLSVYCSFGDWLALLSGRLRPWWGILSGRIKFKGKVAYLKQLPRADFTAYRYNCDDGADAFEQQPSRYWKIPERVLIVNASPRKEKGLTTLLSGYLRRGIEQVVPNVETLELEDYRIEACRGCWHCWLRSEGECIFDRRDDGRELLDRMAESDLIIFAFPLYSDGMPSGLKKLLDRRIATLKPQMVVGKGKTRHPRRVITSQAIAVLSICGFVEKTHFRPVRAHFQALAHNWHTPLVGELFRPAAMTLFHHPLYYDVQRKILAELEKAGRELVQGGRISRHTKKRVEQDFLPVTEYRNCANYFWKKDPQ